MANVVDMEKKKDKGIFATILRRVRMATATSGHAMTRDEAVKEIKRLCDEYDIPCIFFLEPASIKEAKRWKIGRKNNPLWGQI